MNRISVSASRGASRASEIPFTHRVILPNLSARVVTGIAMNRISGLVLASPEISRLKGR
jgi:hypothetical protein